MIAGDFNMDLVKYDNSNKHHHFRNMLTSSGFLPPLFRIKY